MLPFIEHRRCRAQSLFVPLQLILRIFLHGLKFVSGLVLQMDDAGRCQDIIIHWFCAASKREHSFDALQGNMFALLALRGVLDKCDSLSVDMARALSLRVAFDIKAGAVARR